MSPPPRLGLTLCMYPAGLLRAPRFVPPFRPGLWASTVRHSAAAAISIGRSELGRCACGGDETGRQAGRRLSSAESSRARKGRIRIRIVEGGPAASAQALSERGGGMVGSGEKVGLGNFVRFLRPEFELIARQSQPMALHRIVQVGKLRPVALWLLTKVHKE